MLRFYCDRHKAPHWVAQFGRIGYDSAQDRFGSPGHPVSAGIGVGDDLSVRWPADTWVLLTAPTPASHRRRVREAVEGVPEAAPQRDRLEALIAARRPNPRDEDPGVSRPVADVAEYLAGDATRYTFNNRCDRCGFSVPRRAENLAPLLDGFERMAGASGRNDFTLAQLRDAARRWDATRPDAR